MPLLLVYRRLDRWMLLRYPYAWAVRLHAFALGSLLLGNATAYALGSLCKSQGVRVGESELVLAVFALCFVALVWVRRLYATGVRPTDSEGLGSVVFGTAGVLLSLGTNLAVFASASDARFPLYYFDDHLFVDTLTYVFPALLLAATAAAYARAGRLRAFRAMAVGTLYLTGVLTFHVGAEMLWAVLLPVLLCSTSAKIFALLGLKCVIALGMSVGMHSALRQEHFSPLGA